MTWHLYDKGTFIHSFALWIKDAVQWSVTVDISFCVLIYVFKKNGRSLLAGVLLFLYLYFDLFTKPHFV